MAANIHFGERQWSRWDNTRVELGNRRTTQGLLLGYAAQLGKVGDTWCIYVWAGGAIDLLNYSDNGFKSKRDAQAFLDKHEEWKHRILCSRLPGCAHSKYRVDHAASCTLSTFGQEKPAE